MYDILALIFGLPIVPPPRLVALERENARSLNKAHYAWLIRGR